MSVLPLPLPRTVGRAVGEARRDAAHALLLAWRGVTIRRAQRALLQRLLVADTATVDDVRAEVDLPEGVNPVCFGAAPGALAKAGIIAADGFARTSRPVGHARPVTVWRLTDRAAALRWLAANRDLPDPDCESGPGADTND